MLQVYACYQGIGALIDDATILAATPISEFCTAIPDLYNGRCTELQVKLGRYSRGCYSCVALVEAEEWPHALAIAAFQLAKSSV